MAAQDIHGQRPGDGRDRRGRGLRGPNSLPGPLSPNGVPTHRRGRPEFDRLVARILDALAPRFDVEEPVQIVVEEAPLLPPTWTEPVPTSTVRHRPTARSGFGGPTEPQIVLYRLPIVTRSQDQHQLEEAVWAVMLYRLGELWQVSPEDLDPR